MFVRVQGNVWYNLEGHTTRRNDFKAGESDFSQFYGNDSPTQPQTNVAVQKSFFQASTGLPFWPVESVLRIFKTHYTYEKCSAESNETFGTT